MVYNSPLAHPEPYVAKVNELAVEAVTIDKGVDSAQREAAESVTKYGADFNIIIELQECIDKFTPRWVKALQETRDAASAIAAWYRRFVRVFLSLIDDITTEADIKDVITEFNSFLDEQYPSSRYELDGTLGVKATFVEIEGLASAEIIHLRDVLEKTNSLNWSVVVEDLQEEIIPVKAGAEKIEEALVAYATKLN